MTDWFVVHTHPNSEDLAGRNLAQQGFVTYLPAYRRVVRHARRQTEVLRPLFPGYLFVAMNPALARWRAVNSTRGVVRLLADSNRPMPMAETVIEQIRAREDAEGLVCLDEAVSFIPGQKLQVVDGPFRDVWGRFAGLDDRRRVMVLLEMLGRTIHVTLPREAVQA